MSYLATYKVPTTDWQDWLDGKVAFDTDKGACVSPEECEETRKEVREYWLGWGGARGEGRGSARIQLQRLSPLRVHLPLGKPRGLSGENFGSR